MSGLYNVLFGHHSQAEDLLKLLGVSAHDIPRFRSCFWDGTYIVLHTRTGGGNRDYYESLETCRANYPQYFDGKEDPSGPWNDDLRAVAGYVSDEDDDFDSTYANFKFSPPAAAAEALKGLPADTAPADQWKALFAAMDAAKKPASASAEPKL